MPDRLHPELDELRTAIWDAGELSSPVVFRTGTEPPEHVRLLMATLGVPVEVVPVTGRSTVSFQERDVQNGFAHQDYRASRVRAIARVDAGEDPRLCIECATELDVDAPAHDPQCSLKPPPAGKSDVPAGKAGLEKGRDGRLRSKNERSPDGSITGGEQQRRQDAYVDALPMVARCGIEGCGWIFEGTAAEGREQGAAHRASAHPELGNGHRRPRTKPGAGAKPELDIRTDTSEVEIAQERTAPSAAEQPIRTRGAGNPWTKEEIIEAIRAHAAEHGAPPKADHWVKGAPGRPTQSSVIKHFGSWSNAIEAAGFERPPRGGLRAKVQSETSLSSTSSEVAKQEAVVRTGRGGRWTRELVIERIQAWAAAHGGQPPSSTMWVGVEDYPSAAQVKRVFGGSWADAVEAAGFPRPTRGASHPGKSTVPPVVAEAIATWHIKVPGTGLRYRDSMEAYCAADEIEADGERVAEQARYDGNNGKADEALDASRELADKIRVAARLADGEPDEELSSERAASASTERGLARLHVDRELDDEQPPMGARTAEATGRAEGLGSLPGPIADLEVPETIRNDRVEPVEAPPGRRDALADVLTTLGPQIRDGMWSWGSLALMFDGLALECRKEAA